jgi:ATP-binding cassette subfamily F protein 3
LFVTHDRYLVQKIATHLLYLENGRAHVFDRLSAFEQWLAESDSDEVRTEPHQPSLSASTTSQKQDAKLSKNMRDRLEKGVAEVERKITDVESEIAELELSFQNPAAGTDWESMHRRYADLKEQLDTLYADLARHWELMGQ